MPLCVKKISPPWDPTAICHLSVTKGCKGVLIKIFIKFLPASVEGDWSRFEGKHKIHFVQMTKWVTIFYTPAILHGKVFFHWNIFQFDGKSTQARERRMFSHNWCWCWVLMLMPRLVTQLRFQTSYFRCWRTDKEAPTWTNVTIFLFIQKRWAGLLTLLMLPKLHIDTWPSVSYDRTLMSYFTQLK